VTVGDRLLVLVIVVAFLATGLAVEELCRRADARRARRQSSRRDLGDSASTAAGRVCGWCGGPIPPGARADAVYCCTLHRQAAHRFGKLRRRRVAAGRPPPVRLRRPALPEARAPLLRRRRPRHAAEVDHAALVARLVADYPDGWALSTSAAALPVVLPLCPP
jgi:hypothetical protein